MDYTFQEYTIFDTLPKRVMKNTNNIMNIYDRISDYLTLTEIDNLIEESIEAFKTQDIEFTGQVSFSQVTRVFDVETLEGKNLIKENGSTVEVGNSFDSLKLFTTDNVKVYKLGTLLGTIAYEDSLNDLFKNVSYTTDADSVDLVFTKNNDLTTTIILPAVTTSKAGIITGAQFNMIRASYKSVGILNATTSVPLKLRFGNNGGYNFDLELRKATATLDGVMAATDKAKLDSLENANNISVFSTTPVNHTITPTNSSKVIVAELFVCGQNGFELIDQNNTIFYNSFNNAIGKAKIFVIISGGIVNYTICPVGSGSYFTSFLSATSLKIQCLGNGNEFIYGFSKELN